MTREPQFKRCTDLMEKQGAAKLGIMSNFVWATDPKRLGMMLARYKFCAKLLHGKQNVAEIGCGDGFFSRVVAQEVGRLLLTDFDPLLVTAACENGIIAQEHNIVAKPLKGVFDAIYALDVLEHIAPADEGRFMRNILLSLKSRGVVILGMPSLESQQYASPNSKEGHVNCKSGEDFRAAMERYFPNVFMFSMHDEQIGVNFLPMAQYLIAVCVL